MPLLNLVSHMKGTLHSFTLDNGSYFIMDEVSSTFSGRGSAEDHFLHPK